MGDGMKRAVAAAKATRQPATQFDKSRWSIETHELRRDGATIYSADLSKNDNGWYRVWHESGFLSRSDAKKEAIAKIHELETI